MTQTLTLARAEEQRTGPVYWIDHFVTTSSDIPRWAAFSEQLLGGHLMPTPRGLFQFVGPSHIGAFEAKPTRAPSRGLGRGLPRYGFYVERNDLDKHLRRLDALGVPHERPVRKDDEGEAGTSISWQDPDGNQCEFWAPDAPPDGALNQLSSTGVGRISHAVFESRDLERTADFFRRYCELDRSREAGIAADTLVLRMAGGARIIYKRVDRLGGRTAATEPSVAHTALTVHQDSFFANYRRLWADLPQWGLDNIACKPGEDPADLPARCARHPSPEGMQFYAAVEIGDDFFDWDTNKLHFIGGTPRNGTMAEYTDHTVGSYMAAWAREHGGLDGFREMVLGG